MRRFLLLVVTSCLCANVASAIPITWTLQGVTFLDGGTASGSFVYDADTNTFSSINITTTAGTVVTTGATYSFFNFFSNSTTLTVVVTATGDLTGVRDMSLLISAPYLSNAGGTVSTNVLEGTCFNSSCFGINNVLRSTGGSLNGQYVNPVPALSTWGMIGTVLLLGASAFFMLRKNLV
jgi:hypothetical protein